MALLDSQTNFRSFSLKDLLEARDLYHWQLVNKVNVVGTAVGLFRQRIDSTAPGTVSDERAPADLPPPKGPRTFANSEVRPDSWPCILVLVREWLEPEDFAVDKIDPSQLVPPVLYLPDGRATTVCVVKVDVGAPTPSAPARSRWPSSYIGGGCPLIAKVQGTERVASVGCLVSDGHTTYALTNRHVSGPAGEVLSASLRGAVQPIGRTSKLQLTRAPMAEVFPEFPGRRTFVTLDIGLIEIDNLDAWTSQPFGLDTPVGDVADFNELNLGLQLIEAPVEAFGAISGAIEGKIAGLFYRHKSRAGFDYVSEFLIAPADPERQTCPGDSGTVWHLRTTTTQAGVETKLLRPMAVEWGGQTLLGEGGQRFNFALATGLTTACRLLEVDLVSDHNVGANPYWGQTGHYSIATAAIDAVADPALKAFMEANVERVSFRPDELTPAQIKAKLANGDFYELADVPDLVWKNLPGTIPGGRDTAPNVGPEHPNHYADIDAPDAGGGPTLLTLSLADKSNVTPARWAAWYDANGKTDSRERGLLPFRVWQFFDAMVAALQAVDAAGFLAAAGVVSHYVGDACQPLHGSYHSNGFPEQAVPGTKTWPGRGVHSTYETKMVDRHSADLLPLIGPAAAAFTGEIPAIASGQDAAFATVTLMATAQAILPPDELVNDYIALGGGASKRVVDGLWAKFGARTGDLMGAGARYLATLWDSALAAAGTGLPASAGEIAEAPLAAIYQHPDWVPSLTLDQIGAVLSAVVPGGADAPVPATIGRKRRGTVAPAHRPRGTTLA